MVSSEMMRKAILEAYNEQVKKGYIHPAAERPKILDDLESHYRRMESLTLGEIDYIIRATGIKIFFDIAAPDNHRDWLPDIAEDEAWVYGSVYDILDGMHYPKKPPRDD